MNNNRERYRDCIYVYCAFRNTFVGFLSTAKQLVIELFTNRGKKGLDIAMVDHLEQVKLALSPHNN
jgi:hypothetical protein